MDTPTKYKKARLLLDHGRKTGEIDTVPGSLLTSLIWSVITVPPEAFHAATLAVGGAPLTVPVPKMSCCQRVVKRLVGGLPRVILVDAKTGELAVAKVTGLVKGGKAVTITPALIVPKTYRLPSGVAKAHVVHMVSPNLPPYTVSLAQKLRVPPPVGHGLKGKAKTPARARTQTRTAKRRKAA